MRQSYGKVKNIAQNKNLVALQDEFLNYSPYNADRKTHSSRSFLRYATTMLHRRQSDRHKHPSLQFNALVHLVFPHYLSHLLMAHCLDFHCYWCHLNEMVVAYVQIVSVLAEISHH